MSGVLGLDDVGARLNGGGVDGQQHVATLDASAGGRRPGRYFNGRDAFGSLPPVHAVFDLVPAAVHGDVGHCQRGQRHDYHEGKN